MESSMSIERIFRNLGFAFAALTVVAVVAATIEYQPVVNALAQ
jgi:hypothetical protein